MIFNPSPQWYNFECNEDELEDPSTYTNRIPEGYPKPGEYVVIQDYWNNVSRVDGSTDEPKFHVAKVLGYDGGGITTQRPEGILEHTDRRMVFELSDGYGHIDILIDGHLIQTHFKFENDQE